MTPKTIKRLFVKPIVCCLLISLFSTIGHAQRSGSKTDNVTSPKIRKPSKVLYGQASFYANKFHGRRTANGETFNQDKLTAACNVLPLGTWIKVTNLKNGNSIVVKTNDRLHPNTRRIIDLTRSGAKKLGYISRGLTRVKIEVLGRKNI
jgi:rare lipoprotein A